MAQISTRKRGNTWEYSFEIGKIDGKRKRQSKGGFRTKKECLEAGTKAKAEYDKTGLIFKESELSLHDYLDEWIQTYAIPNCKKLTVNSYKQVIKLQIKPFFGTVKLKNVTPKLCQDFMVHLQNKGIANSYIKMTKAILHNALSYAVFPLGYIKTNPVELVRIKLKPEIKPVDKYESITQDQFREILATLTPSTHYVAIPLYLGWHTGLRCGEAVALEWGDIDFETKTLRVNKTMINVGSEYLITPPKTRYSVRTVLMGDTLVEILKNWKMEQEQLAKILGVEPPARVCTNRKLKALTNKYMTQRCSIIRKQVGFTFHFHILRHTHATLLIQNGASIKDVQLRLGHGSIKSTLDVYTHYNKEASERSVDILENVSTNL